MIEDSEAYRKLREEDENLYRRLRYIQDESDREFDEFFSRVPRTSPVREEKTDEGRE